MALLAHKALQTTHLAFRPATQKMYNGMFRLFLAFTIFMKVPISAITSVVLISYMQFLDANSISPSAMANHISAIKAKMALCGLPLAMFDDPRIKYFQKAMVLKRPFKANLKKIIDIDTLQLIIRACDFTYMGQIFKSVYTIAFFSFLRLSNLVPHSAQKFSPLHQLARGDVILAPPGLHLLVKWTKTMQSKNTVKILKIPSLGKNPICPVKAIKNLLAITPGSQNSPLFQYKKAGVWIPMTDSQVRAHLKVILKKLNMDHSSHISCLPAFRCHLCF